MLAGNRGVQGRKRWGKRWQKGNGETACKEVAVEGVNIALGKER